jgi:hypothetical protein
MAIDFSELNGFAPGDVGCGREVVLPQPGVPTSYAIKRPLTL